MKKMKNNVTTTKNGFPVIDVTHKPKRNQADNLRLAGRLSEEDNTNNVGEKISNVPQSPTVEGAISYFEENAKGEFKALYSNTAKWLRSYLTAKVKTLPKNLQAVLPDDVKEVVANETSPTIE